jgi:hypothetical protein
VYARSCDTAQREARDDAGGKLADRLPRIEVARAKLGQFRESAAKLFV